MLNLHLVVLLLDSLKLDLVDGGSVLFKFGLKVRLLELNWFNYFNKVYIHDHLVKNLSISFNTDHGL